MVMGECATSSPELSAIGEELWQEARRRFALVRKLAHDQRRTRNQVSELAAELGLRRSQTYVLLRRFEAEPQLTTLLPTHRGPAAGYTRLSTEIQVVIDEAVDTFYLSKQRPRVSDLVLEIRRRCRALGIKPPGRKGIETRLRLRPAEQIVARRQGRKAARDRFAPVVGKLESVGPLSLVQIDHTPVDVIVVDSETRSPIQRPWLTLAIDVYSRCILGFYLSLEPPSSTSVALCIAHAVLPKDQWLAQRKIDEKWPMHGLFERLHLDNAKEFHAEALRRGCEQYGIALDYRPVRTPHYGGHIERLIGTMMGKVHLLPGTTFSNVGEKGDWDSEKTAMMTIEEVERWLAHAIAGMYHNSPHRALNRTPQVAWDEGLSKRLAEGSARPEINDPRRFVIDFLPLERRLVRREGISLHSIHYWSDVLRKWVGSSDRFLIRYDPTDMSRIYLLAPDGHYYDISYRDLRRPAITLWEHRLALKRLREESAHVDETAIFGAIEKMRRVVEDATYVSKSARRQRARQLRSGRPLPGSPSPLTDAASLPKSESDFERMQPLWENMLKFEEWA